MSRSLLTLTFSNHLLNLNQFSKNSVIKRGLRCRTFPCDPCKPTEHIKSFSCEKINQKCLKCSFWDRRRDPNLGNYWVNQDDTPSCCRSSDPNVQKIPFTPEVEKEVIEIKKPIYPHKPWPTFRNNPWSPTVYIKAPCAWGKCKMLDYSKIPMQLGTSPYIQSYPSLSKSYCTYKPPKDPCKTKEDPCKPKPDPCTTPKPEACAPPPPYNCCNPPPPPGPPMSTCPPTQDPGCNMNLWTQGSCQNQKTIKAAPPFEGVQVCLDEETVAKQKTLRTIVLFGLLPLLAISTGIILELHKAERQKPRPEYIPYTYMYIRTKV